MEKGVTHILDSMQLLLGKKRNLLQVAVNADDSGTVTLIRKQIADLESKIRKLSAYMA